MPRCGIRRGRRSRVCSILNSSTQVSRPSIFGISLGSVLVLAGIGLAITFGVMGVINMAHGELMMLGAYTTFVLQQWLPGATGPGVVALGTGSISGLRGRRHSHRSASVRFTPALPETLLATFGISLLQQAVRSSFSP